MHFRLFAALLLAAVAMPAVAQQDSQSNERVNRRISKIEQELRAVQRRVFPGGTIEPEIPVNRAPGTLPGVPATEATADLTARVDALEARLATLTGQIEQGQNQMRQFESAFSSLREDMQARLDALERGASGGEAAARAAPRGPVENGQAATEASATAEVSSATNGDDAEAAYNAGFRLWDQKRYGEAEKALEAVAKKYPRHRIASWASNLAGRAYLDEGKPATAAKVLLANYQNNPKGERAADSLFFLGQALVKLKKPAEACKVYDELQDVYGPGMRSFLKQRLPQARAEAKCG